MWTRCKSWTTSRPNLYLVLIYVSVASSLSQSLLNWRIQAPQHMIFRNHTTGHSSRLLRNLHVVSLLRQLKRCLWLCWHSVLPAANSLSRVVATPLSLARPTLMMVWPLIWASSIKSLSPPIRLRLLSEREVFGMMFIHTSLPRAWRSLEDESPLLEWVDWRLVEAYLSSLTDMDGHVITSTSTK